jgi:hypothetical protein
MITTFIDTSVDNLNRLILATGFASAEDLAQHLGVHHTTVYRWMAEKQRIPVAVIRYLELKAEKQ